MLYLGELDVAEVEDAGHGAEDLLLLLGGDVEGGEGIDELGVGLLVGFDGTVQRSAA